jgi:hypothetical protein
MGTGTPRFRFRMADRLSPWRGRFIPGLQQAHATGGLVERVENQSQADFALPASRLGVGLHPLHALAYRSDGSRVRTQTLWVRVVDRDYPLDLSMPAAGTLHLNGAAGRTYEILSAGAPEGPWTVRDSVTVSGAGPHAWNDPSAAEAGSRFYQIRIP